MSSSSSTSRRATSRRSSSLCRARRSIRSSSSEVFPRPASQSSRRERSGLSNVRWVLDGSAVSSAIIPILGNADGIRGYFNVPYFPGQTASMREFEERLKTLIGSMPQGRPNNYDMIAYGSAYVVAQAIQATGCELTRHKLINAWSNLKDAGPTKMGGLDVPFRRATRPPIIKGIIGSAPQS